MGRRFEPCRGHLNQQEKALKSRLFCLPINFKMAFYLMNMFRFLKVKLIQDEKAIERRSLEKTNEIHPYLYTLSLKPLHPWRIQYNLGQLLGAFLRTVDNPVDDKSCQTRNIHGNSIALWHLISCHNDWSRTWC